MNYDLPTLNNLFSVKGGVRFVHPFDGVVLHPLTMSGYIILPYQIPILGTQYQLIIELKPNVVFSDIRITQFRFGTASLGCRFGI